MDSSNNPSGNNPQGQEIARGKVEVSAKTRADFENDQLEEMKDISENPLTVSGRPAPKGRRAQRAAKRADRQGQGDQNPEEEPQDQGDNQEAPQEENPEEQQPEENAESEENKEEKEDGESQENNEQQGEAEEQEEGQRLKFIDRIKKTYNDYKKKVAESIKKNLSKEGLKKAGAWIVRALLSNPYFWAVLIIGFILILIVGSCSKQSGKTPYQQLNRQTDERLDLRLLAAAGDKPAQRQLITYQSQDIKKELGKISTDNAEAKSIIDQINKLLDEIIALSENPQAIAAKIKEILALLDKLKGLLSGSPGTIDNIKNMVNNLSTMLDYYQKGHIVLNPKDMDYVRNYDIDRRIAEMLVYLVTPKDQGGGGHERIKVSRIKFSYDSERKSGSKETDFAETEEPNISAHYSGQAADISEIDYIKCTQIKRRRVGDKKEAMPAIPIKVAWQTEEGYLKAGGADAFGQNMHQAFKNLGAGSMGDLCIEQIADILGIDIDPKKLKGKSLAEITKYVGIAYLKENLDIPGDYELGNDLDDISNNIGRAYLAKSLGVPIEGIQGNSQEDLLANIGRAALEEKMGLPPGSLAGNNSNEIFASVGRRKMEKSLDIGRDSLNIPFSNADSFKRALGQGRVEDSLGFKNQTFYGGSAEDVKKRVTKEMFEMTFANPTAIDNFLEIAGGTTEKLVSGNLSPDAYNALVGDIVLKQELYVYSDPQKRAEALDVSRADLDALMRGDKGAFVGMGKYTVAKAFSAENTQQGQFISWFNTKNKPQNLDPDYLGGQFGLREGDVGKIFIDDLGRLVFERIGNSIVLNNLQNNSPLAGYLAPVKELKFYTDRVNIIKDNFNGIKNNANDSEVRVKAADSEQIASGLLSEISISAIKGKVKDLQKNLQFIEDKAKAGNDTKTLDRVKAIKKAINEIIEGKELSSFESLDASSINSQTNPQVGLTKKDVLAVLTGKKKVDELAVSIGLSKWETELDLPVGSLTEIYKGLKASGLSDPSETFLVSVGKAKVREYGGVFGREAATVDKDLGLPAGTTADFRAGKISENAYYKKVGMGSTNSIAAGLLNKQLGLTNNPYALNGGDVNKMLSGGWFWTALKIGGSAMDEAMGFPPGGALDVIQQAGDPSDLPELLAEKKLGIMAGLNHPVSLNGDIPYNLGRAKIEQQLWLKSNEINDSNLAAKIQDYTGGNVDSLSRLDMTFGLKSEDTKKLLAGSIAPHDYIAKVGDYLKTSVIYDQLANFAPQLKNKDLKEVSLALANQTGTPQEILEAAGAKQVGLMLGLDFPVSVKGNFKDNLGEGLIEDRLGLKNGSFKDNLDIAVANNGQQKFESAFYIDSGKLAEAKIAGSDYWKDSFHKNYANIVDSRLNIPSGSTVDFLTGKIDLGAYVDRAGRSTLNEVTVDKLTDFMGLDDNYKTAAQTLVSVFNSDPSLSSPQSKAKVFNALMGVAGMNLDNKTKFDPGTWQKILFVDPADPEHTGPKHAKETVLEQGKKWMPKWLGMEPQYEPYIDLVYEKASGMNDEKEMMNAIKKITGIPNDADADRFLDGDLKGGIYAWGAAQIVTQYNQEFQGTGSQLDYYKVKAAYFNDPSGEQATGDKAVADFKTKCGQCELSPEVEESVRNQAIAEARDNSKKQVQYSVVDMQLHKLDKNIPPGFTLAMKEGTSEQKWTMGLSYVGNMLHSENNNIPPEIANDLKKYFDPSSPTFHDPKALSSSTYGFLDIQMKAWFGDFIQPGTAQALFQFGQTGKLGSPSDKGSLTQIYANYGINIVTNWADKQFGLPNGSTKLFYDYFVKYQQAIEKYKAAQAAYAAAKTAENLKNLTASEDALNALEAEAATFIVTTVFKNQLAAVDQKLGLVPGSSAMIVGMAAQYWIAGGVSPITIGLFVLTNLFGVYRIDVTCTACGYYPGLGGSPGWILGRGQTSQLLKTENICPLPEFDGTDANEYKQGTIKAAQWKVNQVIGDLLNLDSKMKDKNLLPTQIMTLRQEDVDSYASLLNDKYGLAGQRGNSGLWANPLMWDHLHVGY